jgi:hypothetical protein
MPRMRPLELLLEQLWSPAIVDDAVRVTLDGPEPGWTEHESYWMFPDADRARLVLPRGPRRVTAAAATNYRGMRRPTKNLGRTVMGALATAGLPLSPARLSVLVRDDRPELAEGLPLHVLARALGREDGERLHAATGVRSGANRKATLHLLSERGVPVGYAKFGWNDATDQFVRTEGAALREVGGREGPMRAPALLAQADYHGHPVIVTEPLPLGVRGARSRHAPPPTPQELFFLCPVHRHARVADTGHFTALAGRLDGLSGDPVAGAVARSTAPLVELLRTRRGEVPVTTRWHGDMAPWNRARDTDGQLWVWDWESAEPDAVAGLDALHWAFSVRRPASGRNETVDLAGCLHDSAGHLRAAGVRPEAWGDVAAVYALTVVERAADLARRSGGWERLWIGPEHLALLVAQATALTPAA